MLISIIILYVFSYCSSWAPQNTNVQIAVLICTVVLFFKGLGINHFAISPHSLEVKLAEVKKIQAYVEDTLPIIIKLIVGSSDPKTGTSSILPGGGRLVIYDLIQQIKKSSSYSLERKEELIRNLKWVLLRWMFHSLCRTPIIENLKNKSELLHKPKNQDGRVNILEDTLQKIQGAMKSVNDPRKEFSWLSDQIKELKTIDIQDKITYQEAVDFKRALDSYEKTISAFIKSDFIDPSFLTEGKFSD